MALRKRAEVDSKYVLFFNSSMDSELKLSLSRYALLLFSCFLFYTYNKLSFHQCASTLCVCRIASAFAELALVYYREEGRRIKSRIEKRSSNSLDLNVRYCFKVSKLFYYLLSLFSRIILFQSIWEKEVIHAMASRSLYMQSFVEIGVKL